MCKVKTLTRHPILLLWFVVTVAGCAPANRDELTKEVLKADSDFAAVLEKHQQLASRIETYQRELALKRSTVERNIAQLRKDLVAAVASVRAKTADVKKKMEPDQKQLEGELTQAVTELREKQSQRAILGRQITQQRKTLQASTASDQTRQEAQLNEILGDAKRLDHELTTIKAHIRLLKIKLLLIKL